MLHTLACGYFQRALLFAVPIGGLSGLIGLGGGEFRLPILIHLIRFPARTAVPINLVISLATLAVALFARNLSVPTDSVSAHVPEMLGLAAGGMLAAVAGTRLVSRLSDRRLTRALAILLAALGMLLLAEAFVPFAHGVAADHPAALRAAFGIVLGLGVGIVSSMLGVAGGELLIPSLVFVFGLDIKVAGTASLMISLLVVSVGIWRYWRMGALVVSGGPPRIAAAMSLGSVIGAGFGALAVASAPGAVLKAVLGAVLLVAAAKTAVSIRDDGRSA